MKKNLILLLTLFSISLVIASSSTLGIFKQGEDIELKQTCVINGDFCDTCVISSVSNKNGNIIEGINMIKGEYEFYYILDESYVTQLGKHDVNGYCDYGSNLKKNFIYEFKVTKTGDIVETSESLMYIIILIFISLFLAGGVYISIVTPYENLGEMTRDGEAITKVTKSKYVKIMATWFSYGLFLTLITILAGMTNNYIQFEEMKNMFTASYLFLSVLGYGISVLSIWLIFYNIWKDIILNKTILREGKALLKEL